VDLPATITPVTVQRLTDAAYRTLKDQILTQAFAPGQRLNVDELAGRMGMSRTPVKDALNALASEGLVEILPRKGTFVAGLSADTIAEVFELRRALELLAAELLVERVNDDDLHRLRDRLAALDTPLTAGTDADEHLRRNLAFHRLFVELAGNRTLLEMYEELNAHIQIARVHARWQNWQRRRQQERDEHQMILHALEIRDWPRLAAAVNAHIRRSKQSLIEDLRSTTVIPHGTEEVGGTRGTDVRVSHAR
jgi:DNA-binding GntR family transcriptional regulator